MSEPLTRLLSLWREPELARSIELSTWHTILRAGRAMSLLARLAAKLCDAGVADELPDQVQRHLEAAMAVAQQHERIIRWEVNRLRRATAGLDVPVVLLKGAAYVIADLPPARGRLVSDVDVLVPRDRIADVEQALLEAGFDHTIDDVYDQRYYRRWMHEIPPLQHRRRGTTVDVHHTILPTTGRVTVDARLLWQRVQQLDPIRDLDHVTGVAAAAGSGIGTMHVLGPADMVLHSAVHLFQDGQVAGQLRDLMDLHELIETFTHHDGRFTARLIERAGELGLATPLAYVQRYVPRVLGVSSSLDGQPIPGASRAGRWLVMDRLVPTALLTDVGGQGTWPQRMASAALYLRSHWLRMPPMMLARHLMIKAIRRRDHPKAPTQGDPQAKIDR